MIQFGLRLHDAEKLPIEQVLPLVRQKGFSCVHLAPEQIPEGGAQHPFCPYPRLRGLSAPSVCKK